MLAACLTVARSAAFSELATTADRNRKRNMTMSQQKSPSMRNCQSDLSPQVTRTISRSAAMRMSWLRMRTLPLPAMRKCAMPKLRCANPAPPTKRNRRAG